MVKCEFYRIREDGVLLVQSKSTEGKMLLQLESDLLMKDPIDVGEKYFDPVAFEVKYRPVYYTYIETDEKIPEDESKEEV